MLQFFQTRYLSFNIPQTFFQVLYLISLQPCAPKILHGIPYTKPHMLGYVDALYPRRMIRVMTGMFYGVVHFQLSPE